MKIIALLLLFVSINTTYGQSPFANCMSKDFAEYEQALIRVDDAISKYLVTWGPNLHETYKSLLKEKPGTPQFTKLDEQLKNIKKEEDVAFNKLVKELDNLKNKKKSLDSAYTKCKKAK